MGSAPDAAFLVLVSASSPLYVLLQPRQVGSQASEAMFVPAGGSVSQLPTHYPHCPQSLKRRSSNASDCTNRSRPRRRDCSQPRGRLERAISSDSRLTGAIPKCYQQHPQTSMEQEPGATSSETDIHHVLHTVVQLSTNQ
ncbi:hypothetical protein NQ317_014184 [Molorchus minor]|uniref:Uncharacterized protein n=1 Tax=Molorchus minor TaxID=1323400 RepID=A0ABQ9JKI3_9CUCU|nr:hypothetical protein NQ317_014184 [Molorchus minor]